MQTFTSETQRNLYQSDYLAWYEKTLVQLKNNQLNELDLESLSEVLENLVRDAKRIGESYLRQIMAHLFRNKFSLFSILKIDNFSKILGLTGILCLKTLENRQ